ncbi:MAG: lipid-A-disaccharide synthase [Gemmatimonadetes bacterium]|nr:lipid-A-disaccharide synthase [Gemmatimonadota bacterium]
MTEILIVAGEPSGDQLGGEFVEAAVRMRPDLRFFGATGTELEAAGVERVVATAELSAMGLTEVVSRLPAAWRALSRLTLEAERRGAAGAILIDSPDFNLRLAGRLARRGIPAVQYVGPTVWAWRPGRVRTLERAVRRLLVTLPFEPAVYAGTGVDAVYVGNPAVDRVPAEPPPRREVARALGADPSVPWVGLLPGSREAELRRLGPVFAEAAARIRGAVPAVEFVAPVAPGVHPETVARLLTPAATRFAGAQAGISPPVRLADRDRYAALAHCEAAIAASGTISLELALLGVPHVVAYRVSRVTWGVARLLVDVDHLALPNLIAGRRVVPELLQAAATPDALAAPVVTWLTDSGARRAVQRGLAEVREALGPSGVARRAARAALEALGLPPSLA